MWLYLLTGYVIWLGVAAPAAGLLVVILATLPFERALLLGADLRFCRRGIRCLVVYSQSPVWRDHIAEKWMPRPAPVARTLDWSRANWGRTLEVDSSIGSAGASGIQSCGHRLSRLAPSLRLPLFRSVPRGKHGRTHYLRRLEVDMFAAIARRS